MSSDSGNRDADMAQQTPRLGASDDLLQHDCPTTSVTISEQLTGFDLGYSEDVYSRKDLDLDDAANEDSRSPVSGYSSRHGSLTINETALGRFKDFDLGVYEHAVTQESLDLDDAANRGSVLSLDSPSPSNTTFDCFNDHDLGYSEHAYAQENFDLDDAANEGSGSSLDSYTPSNATLDHYSEHAYAQENLDLDDAANEGSESADDARTLPATSVVTQHAIERYTTVASVFENVDGAITVNKVTCTNPYMLCPYHHNQTEIVNPASLERERGVRTQLMCERRESSTTTSWRQIGLRQESIEREFGCFETWGYRLRDAENEEAISERDGECGVRIVEFGDEVLRVQVFDSRGRSLKDDV